MEHRWGRRRSVEATVMIDLGRGILEHGLARNVSASGMLVQMASGSTPAPHTPVSILYVERTQGRHQVHRIEAAVVRHAGDGIGFVYHDFNPPECAALLHLAGDAASMTRTVMQSRDAGTGLLPHPIRTHTDSGSSHQHRRDG